MTVPPDHGKNLIIVIPISAILAFIIIVVLCKTCRKDKVKDIHLQSVPEIGNAFDYSDLLIGKEEQ